ncbi:MAG: hypothetical protein C5B49_11090 [Bdellovibrio sp.]|nr:MAG: hypothetical protein C5B49_11090 [Bdellovibrio sp.]
MILRRILPLVSFFSILFSILAGNASAHTTRELALIHFQNKFIRLMMRNNVPANRLHFRRKPGELQRSLQLFSRHEDVAKGAVAEIAKDPNPSMQDWAALALVASSGVRDAAFFEPLENVKPEVHFWGIIAYELRAKPPQLASIRGILDLLSTVQRPSPWPLSLRGQLDEIREYLLDRIGKLTPDPSFDDPEMLVAQAEDRVRKLDIDYDLARGVNQATRSRLLVETFNAENESLAAQLAKANDDMLWFYKQKVDLVLLLGLLRDLNELIEFPNPSRVSLEALKRAKDQFLALLAEPESAYASQPRQEILIFPRMTWPCRYFRTCQMIARKPFNRWWPTAADYRPTNGSLSPSWPGQELARRAFFHPWAIVSCQGIFS